MTERGTTFRNLTRRITLIEGVPHAKLDGSLITLESQSFNGKPIPNMYEYVVTEPTGTIWL
tara:strand:+ start:722 stop:904 length:183 start_codon:yes stop_codon:yes gene_type:complete